MNRKLVNGVIVGALLVGAAYGANSSFFGLIGPQADGTGITPNHWMLTPAGLQVEIGDRPMGMATSPDGRFLAIVNCGQGVQSLALFDTFTRKVVQSIAYNAPEALYLGVVWSSDGKGLYASAGGNNKVRTYSFDGKTLLETAPIVLGDAATPIFPAGLAISGDGKTLYVANNLGNTVSFVDTANRAATSFKSVKLSEVASAKDIGALPYNLQLSTDGKTLYASLWNAKSVAVIDTASLKETARVEVGDHPTGMALSPDGKTLYVANANSDSVSLIATESNKTSGSIVLAPYEKAPMGSMPNALSLSQDGKTLYVANGGNNDLALVDTGSLKVRGLIPTAWFPSTVSTSRDGKLIFVTNMKGLGAGPNPGGPVPEKRNPAEQYIANRARGSISVIATPDAKELEAITASVVKNNGFDETRQTITRTQADTTAHAIPRRTGDPSPIKHVIYVIKENRTYDQLYGTLKDGNGEPSLELYGQDITPNQRALSLEYGLLDNFYADAEVSADGHNWTMGAIATDYVQKNWVANYSPRGRSYDFEGGSSAPAPTGGYLFDYAKRAGITYRSYGEFNDFASTAPNVKAAAFAPAVVDHISPTYPGYDMSISDQVRFEAWKKEFDEYAKNGQLPQLSVVRLPRDHTNGTRAGSPIPAAYIADNDLALGKLVQAVSSSVYWKDTAIFVLEDDAQNGADHVDAHRMPALAISAYNKRGTRDHTMYSTSSMLRTMELILGLQPMTQFDAASTPMVALFQDTPDLKAYKAITPKQSLDTLNTALSYRATDSANLDFSHEDRVDANTLNDILWHASKGADATMPNSMTNLRANPINQEAWRENRRIHASSLKPSKSEKLVRNQISKALNPENQYLENR
jgi:YVTN family beta-propeller protein